MTVNLIFDKKNSKCTVFIDLFQPFIILAYTYIKQYINAI